MPPQWRRPGERSVNLSGPARRHRPRTARCDPLDLVSACLYRRRRPARGTASVARAQHQACPRGDRRLYRYVRGRARGSSGPSRAVTNNLATARPQSRKLVRALQRHRPRQLCARRRPARPCGPSWGGPRGHRWWGCSATAGAPGSRHADRCRPPFAPGCPAPRFAFVGALENPAYEAHLRRRLADAGLTEAFQFTGWRMDVPHLMRAADCRWTRPRQRSGGAVVHGIDGDGSSAGRHRTGAPPVRPGRRDWPLFAPGDAATLAGHVSTLPLESGAARRMGEAGRSRVERAFTVEQHVAAMFQLYEQARVGRS